MSNSVSFPGCGARFLNRAYARLARRQAGADGFVSHPEPRIIGSSARGQQVVAGKLLLAGYLVESQDTGLWEVKPPAPAFEAERQGFVWLDDLAAVGDRKAREKAQRWLWGWIDRYGAGQGPGWVPELTGRRVLRWINHAGFLLGKQARVEQDRFFCALTHQAWFLSKRWQGAAPGLPRIEALTGLLHAGLLLKGKEDLADPAVRGLIRECETVIDAQGGLPTRNPEALLEVFTMLTLAGRALHDAGRGISQAHSAAIERIAPTLRGLRHADGGLARFHGGGQGSEGRLDQALVASHTRPRHSQDLAMGYARLSARRTSVIIDASPPPSGAMGYDAHASTLAFELTSGRRPLIVNCGSGASFGPEWLRAGRATPSHSTLSLGRYSSARLAKPVKGREPLIQPPVNVPVECTVTPRGTCFQAGHDGYLREFGLTHVRSLTLDFEGRMLTGEDMLLAVEQTDRRRFDRVIDRVGLSGVEFAIRLHLHPDVDAALDAEGATVLMTLNSGEEWEFRHDKNAALSLEPSMYMQSDRLNPRPTRQIVLTGRARDHATRVRWALSKAHDSPTALRDLHRDDGLDDD
ncbi:heparinase II/III family protein [Pontibaca salina]|uniref:Heparinase II/III family protein n=1 Tax=Pontibaca salina TaxID=2795731 RepID=A0A934HHY0_9RHOB|nr:heparinase II/III family protein [Pontibaca salina]MBI6628489.1 heparinase II/III family protein [Pontibaca salina]